MESGDFFTFDGIKINCRIVGSGPPMVLLNGLGGSFPAWKYIVQEFSDKYTIYSYDYRGLFESEKPESLMSITIENQVKDLHELLKFHNIEKAVFVGWSYGGQVMIEAYKLFPEKFISIILLNALIGPATDGFPLSDLLKPLFTRLTTLLKPAWYIFSPVAEKAISSNVAISLVKSIGLVGKNLDELVFHEVASSFISLDHDVFIRTIQSSQEYDGSEILSEIKVNTLIIGGSRDFIVLPNMLRSIASKIANSKLVFIPGTSHYTALEAPNKVLDEMKKFLLSEEERNNK